MFQKQITTFNDIGYKIYKLNKETVKVLHSSEDVYAHSILATNILAITGFKLILKLLIPIPHIIGTSIGMYCTPKLQISSPKCLCYFSMNIQPYVLFFFLV